MRLELNTELLLLCSLLFVFVSLWLTRFGASKKTAIRGASFLGAFVLPAFVPGHGEFVMLLPNAALFSIQSQFTWGIGLFFLVIYYVFLVKLLTWLSRKKIQ